MAQESRSHDCVDGLIWIGNAPGKYRTVDEFVKEAALRGCCRQLPFIPKWVVPGKSKIFLVHRDNHKLSSRGSIFGYFVLYKLEVPNGNGVPADPPTPPRPIRTPPPKNPKLIIPDYGNDEYPVHERVAHVWTKCEGHRMCSLRKGNNAVYAMDALSAVTLNEYRRRLFKLLKGMTKKEIESQLREFQRKNAHAWREWQKFRSMCIHWEHENMLSRFVGPFHDAVERYYKRWIPVYEPCPRLKGKIEVKGELVVFKRPYRPVFEMIPQASFKGIWHIDGNRLISQVIDHKSRKLLFAKIYTCGESACPETGPITRKSQLSDCLRRELKISNEMARTFLAKLSCLASNQLRQHGRFRLPQIGTIKIQRSRTTDFKFIPSKSILENPDCRKNPKKKKRIEEQ
jgi:hypothetical protein